MRQAGPGLASVVVKLHQTEDQVCRDELELVGGIGDDVPRQSKQRCHRLSHRWSRRRTQLSLSQKELIAWLLQSV